MAQSRSDLFSKLTDRGEDVVGKISDMPAAQRIFDAGMQLKARVDDMQKKMRGLDDLERRVKALEKKVDELSRSAGGSARRTTAKRSTTKRTTTQAKKKPSA
jgi:uncharacterized protein YoxC